MSLKNHTDIGDIGYYMYIVYSIYKVRQPQKNKLLI